MTRAVRRALDYVEDTCGWSRTGAQGLVVEKGPASFCRASNMAHREPKTRSFITHALAINVTVLEDGKSRAIDSTHFYHHKMAAGALYRASLPADSLSSALRFAR